MRREGSPETERLNVRYAHAVLEPNRSVAEPLLLVGELDEAGSRMGWEGPPLDGEIRDGGTTTPGLALDGCSDGAEGTQEVGAIDGVRGGGIDHSSADDIRVGIAGVRGQDLRTPVVRGQAMIFGPGNDISTSRLGTARTEVKNRGIRDIEMTDASRK